MRQAFAEYTGALPVESGAHVESMADVQAAMRQGGAVLAYLGSEAVGCARYLPEPADLYVGRVAVVPTRRRQGIASAMMRFLEDVAVSLGRQSIRIQVRDSLPSNVALYRALGYDLISIDAHSRGPDKVWTLRKMVQPPEN
ncbi:MAG: GNAT family N-acetyltransferase [Chloroflexi bacterium]|nr:GNAT family N-acetyltransferase [Chloroflexota bacterium]